jgi:hypothetical protein
MLIYVMCESFLTIPSWLQQVETRQYFYMHLYYAVFESSPRYALVFAVLYKAAKVLGQFCSQYPRLCG